jgi:hypothetical protein
MKLSFEKKNNGESVIIMNILIYPQNKNIYILKTSGKKLLECDQALID